MSDVGPISAGRSKHLLWERAVGRRQRVSAHSFAARRPRKIYFRNPVTLGPPVSSWRRGARHLRGARRLFDIVNLLQRSGSLELPACTQGKPGALLPRAKKACPFKPAKGRLLRLQAAPIVKKPAETDLDKGAFSKGAPRGAAGQVRAGLIAGRKSGNRFFANPARRSIDWNIGRDSEIAPDVLIAGGLPVKRRLGAGEGPWFSKIDAAQGVATRFDAHQRRRLARFNREKNDGVDPGADEIGA